MRSLVTSAVVALSFALAGSAGAADLYNSNGYKDGAVSAAPISGGFYVGARVGAAFSDLTAEGSTKNPSGIAGYGTAGYDALLSNGFLLGLYGEFGAQDGQIPGEKVSQRLEWGAGVKVGHQAGPAVLFTKLGYTGLEFTGGGVNETINGFAVTPGIDYPLGGGWSATGEVKISFYPEQTLSVGPKIEDTIFEPLVGFTYHFGQSSASLK